MTQKYNQPIPRGRDRAEMAAALRVRRAEIQLRNHLADVAVMENEISVQNTESGLSARFTKGLPHNTNGDVTQADYDAMRKAINADPASNSNPSKAFVFKAPVADPAIFKTRPDGKTPGLRVWESPRAGHVYDTEGGDIDAFVMAPAPALDPNNIDELTAEMGEVYALALLRDVGFSNIAQQKGDTATGCAVKDITNALLSLPYFKTASAKGTAAARRLQGRKNSVGHVTSKELFRSSTAFGKVGPFVSQFMLIGTRGGAASGNIGYGAQIINQKSGTYHEGADFMTTWDWWLDVQNGANLSKVIEKAQAYARYICTPRDFAAYVHIDQLYQAYLNAALILLDGKKAKFDRGLPEPNTFEGKDTRAAFATFGGPHLLAAVTEVSSRALKAVRRQKFNIHQRCRPERIAAMLTRVAAGKNDGLTPEEVLAELCSKVGDAVCLGGNFGYPNSILKINPVDNFRQSRWGGELSPFFLS